MTFLNNAQIMLCEIIPSDNLSKIKIPRAFSQAAKSEIHLNKSGTIYDAFEPQLHKKRELKSRPLLEQQLK
jgi:hypothetical protein